VVTPENKDTLAVQAAQGWPEKARQQAITDAASCVQASHFLRGVKFLRAEIQQWFEPHIEAAMETKRKADAARKALVDERDRMEAPLVEAEGIMKRSLLAWEQTQEAARLAEERRLQEEAQKQAEAVTLAVAADLELQATASGDDEMLAEAHSILSQPIEAPVVSVKTFVPKVQGVSYRDNWKAHPTIDVKTLAGAVAAEQAPATFLQPNLTAINQFARATQGAQSVPGVKFFNDRQVTARG
jgi:hypothetical protein